VGVQRLLYITYSRLKEGSQIMQGGEGPGRERTRMGVHGVSPACPGSGSMLPPKKTASIAAGFVVYRMDEIGWRFSPAGRTPDGPGRAPCRKEAIRFRVIGGSFQRGDRSFAGPLLYQLARCTRPNGVVLSCRDSHDLAPIVAAKRLGALYRSGLSRDRLKTKNPDSPAMRRARAGMW
jgi:hypothetical protein